MLQKEILAEIARRASAEPMGQYAFATPVADGFTCLGRVFIGIAELREWLAESGLRPVCGRIIPVRHGRRGRPLVGAPDCPVCGGVMLVQHTGPGKRYCKCPTCGKNTIFEQPMENTND